MVAGEVPPPAKSVVVLVRIVSIAGEHRRPPGANGEASLDAPPQPLEARAEDGHLDARHGCTD